MYILMNIANIDNKHYTKYSKHKKHKTCSQKGVNKFKSDQVAKIIIRTRADHTLLQAQWACTYSSLYGRYRASGVFTTKQAI